MIEPIFMHELAAGDVLGIAPDVIAFFNTLPCFQLILLSDSRTSDSLAFPVYARASAVCAPRRVRLQRSQT